ncbi:MAG: 4a-hydroxytetrahydrobiopterin dehydratase [Melioribacteraceae bacterium]|nr:4a-hydroxytetrahydrobiopterin dehydratase [Melioribacteraceae bacterium]
MLLSKNEIEDELKNLKGWNVENNSLIKEFICKDFSDAISLQVKIGFIAEKMDHHPDFFLHSWNKIKVIITTHSEGGITNKDIELVKQIEKLF